MQRHFAGIHVVYRALCALVLGLGLFAGAGTAAKAETRVALVIGISEYQYAPHLVNAPEDAKRIAAGLRRVGFTVTELSSRLTKSEFEAALNAFSSQAAGADVAVIYYAGHGMEKDGVNYLIPVDAALRRDTDVLYQTVPLQLVLDAVSPAQRLKIVILDACRDNPFAPGMTLSRGKRSLSRGLAPVSTEDGETLIVYSTAAEKTATDDGPFARALAARLAEPGVDVLRVFGRTREDVVKATEGRQQPAIYGTPGGEPYYFVAADPVRPVSGPVVNPVPSAWEVEQAVWNSAKDCAGYQGYLSSYPNGAFVGLAKAKLSSCGGGAITNTALQLEPQPLAQSNVMKPLSHFRDCADVCPEIVVIPSSSFRMGSPAGEAGRYGDEGPMHSVNIQSFALGAYDVTFQEWDACVSGGGCNGYRPDDRGWGRGKHPVINVSWEDAQSYVRWLSEKTGKTYRLASESEWEYAARAGTTMAYYWSDSIGSGHANCDGCGSAWDGQQTSPVGSFAANGWGLYDMSGNVWQWVSRAPGSG